MQDEVTLGSLIDGSTDALKQHIADKDLGYVKSLINTLKATFFTLEKTKDELMKKTEGRELDTKASDEDKKIVHTIQGLYIKMSKVELLILVLQEEEKNRALKD